MILIEMRVATMSQISPLMTYNQLFAKEQIDT
jgi:hypothetical protein